MGILKPHQKHQVFELSHTRCKPSHWEWPQHGGVGGPLSHHLVTLGLGKDLHVCLQALVQVIVFHADDTQPTSNDTGNGLPVSAMDSSEPEISCHGETLPGVMKTFPSISAPCLSL